MVNIKLPMSYQFPENVYLAHIWSNRWVSFLQIGGRGVENMLQQCQDQLIMDILSI